ncbi:hypothetical protein SUGI_0996530 [Cryptomeria japonica]|uniref:phospholipase D alpha 1 n=1 Tax=Cryptomeria japonica TaxID=3369 RepID=UPI002414C775|nr:phospholipase D alpha 1 [Cryptomeria japonica]GLJ47211.1 hypothetical protein SUGI_0996530 [Cryptomeria japonica]
MASTVVHGTLHATVLQGKHLLHGLSAVLTKAAEGIKEVLHVDHCHHKFYATIDFGAARVARSRVVTHNPVNPVWNETFHVLCAYTSSEYVVVSVKNQLPVSAEVIGRTRIPISEILSGEVIEGWYDLYNEDFSEKLKKAQIQIRLQFSDVTEDQHWGAGIRDRDFAGVENVYFKQRNGCMVTLYQNSHLSREFCPRIELQGGGLYSPPRLWEEVYEYINGAQVFIYIAGWSVYTEFTLVRDRERMIAGAEGVTLGELLKKKADQGVRVLVLIWEDRTAVKLLGNEGLMRTHCDETFEYFKDSNVQCVLSPRHPDHHSLSIVESAEVEVQFTHHQKTVSLDAPIEPGSTALHVVSFVGGIDLTNGRYDTEKHTLFGGLDTVFKHDFLQHNFKGADLRHGGPREPWHDTHSKIEGPAALDVITNFTQRWTRQADPSLLIDLGQMTHFIIPEGPKAWNVQIFRSIDDGSVRGFSENLSGVLGLETIKDEVVDQSIHWAYVHAIRRAKHFIYIQNQYFFGSCESWDKDQDCGCLHLVPIEIALKIVSKIRAKERFAVYVVTPMWPEGIPEGDTVQAILHWNRNTIEIMYAMIGQALREEGSSDSPTDYLNFFCLGNRETHIPGEYVAPETPEEGTDYWNAQMNRRFLIYVHSKLMIVDDEYVIMGSANLNQRSMDGARDTEIAQGSYQPHHINSKDGHHRARGQIFGYRMSLWYEHFAKHNGGLRHEYLHPESRSCVRMVRGFAERTWEFFVGEEINDLPGHLLPFPVRITRDGNVVELEGHPVFPDTKAPIAGRKSDVIPPIITT